MQRLKEISENLAIEYDDHTNRLYQAQNMTNGILKSLKDTAASAIRVKNSVLRQSSWWPYVLCPVASVWLGSYRLPPSGVRNAFLIALGE